MDALVSLRKKIDNIDEKMLTLLAQRQTVVKKIGIVKKKQGLPVFDETREKHKIEALMGLAQQNRLSRDFVKRLWSTIFENSREMQ